MEVAGADVAGVMVADGVVDGVVAAGCVAAGGSASCAYEQFTATKDTSAAARPMVFSRPDLTADTDAATGCKWISPPGVRGVSMESRWSQVPQGTWPVRFGEVYPISDP